MFKEKAKGFKLSRSSKLLVFILILFALPVAFMYFYVKIFIKLFKKIYTKYKETNSFKFFDPKDYLILIVLVIMIVLVPVYGHEASVKQEQKQAKQELLLKQEEKEKLIQEQKKAAEKAAKEEANKKNPEYRFRQDLKKDIPYTKAGALPEDIKKGMSAAEIIDYEEKLRDIVLNHAVFINTLTIKKHTKEIVKAQMTFSDAKVKIDTLGTNKEGTKIITKGIVTCKNAVSVEIRHNFQVQYDLEGNFIKGILNENIVFTE